MAFICKDKDVDAEACTDRNHLTLRQAKFIAQDPSIKFNYRILFDICFTKKFSKVCQKYRNRKATPNSLEMGVCFLIHFADLTLTPLTKLQLDRFY